MTGLWGGALARGGGQKKKKKKKGVAWNYGGEKVSSLGAEGSPGDRSSSQGGASSQGEGGIQTPAIQAPGHECTMAGLDHDWTMTGPWLDHDWIMAEP